MIAPKMESSVKNDMSCPKCAKPYKLKNALEKHVTVCVRVVNKSTLSKINNKKKSASEGIVKVAGDQPETVIRKAQKSKKSVKIAEAVPSAEKSKSKKTPRVLPNGQSTIGLNYLLQQADRETRWQLIQCNMNQILDETLSSSQAVPGLTQELPPSNLNTANHHQGAVQATDIDTGGIATSSWWKAASSAPLTRTQCQSEPRVEISLVEVPVTQRTPYRDRDRLMTRVKDRVITSPSVQAGGGETTSAASATAAGDTVSVERNADTELLERIQGCVVQSGHQFSSMLDNQLFSDMEIKTSDSGRIACHKLLLAAAFPKASCFLDNHVTVDMTGLDKTQLLFWLSGVYTSDWSAAREHLNESAIKYIQSFIQFACSWTPNHQSGAHVRKASGVKANKSKLKKTENKTTRSQKEMSKKTGSPPVYVKNTLCAIETDKILQPKSDKTVNKLTSFDKEKVDKPTPATKTKSSKSVKRKSAHKYTPILSPPPPQKKKISPLLSTIGLSLISSTNPTINSSDQLPVICDNTLVDVSSVSVNTNDCPNIPTTELPPKYNPVTPAGNIEEKQAEQQGGLHVRMSSCDNLRQEKNLAVLAHTAVNSHSICLDTSHRSENKQSCYNVLSTPQLNNESQIQKYLPATENLQDKIAPALISKTNTFHATHIQQEHGQVLMSQAASGSLLIHNKDKENLISTCPEDSCSDDLFIESFSAEDDDNDETMFTL